ncbi:MAG: hypothetical protein HRU14_15970 [Planctomycetes bacterium]|nr:hypothetical protein [Planctomycetota bacterium]
MQRVLFTLWIVSATVSAQVGAGTLCQSLDLFQLGGVNSIQLPGNPSITPNEVTAWASSDGAGGMRSLFNAQQLGVLLGDTNGDGLPFDWPDIDAIHLPAPSVTSGRTQPDIYDCRFSLSSTISSNGLVIATPGDVVGFTGVGSLTTVVTRSQLQAALGTSTSLDVDAYTELPGGAIMVSFTIFGGGTNIVNPLSGQTGGWVSFSPGDVFIIRPPFGALSALFAYRQPELQVVVNFYYGSWPNPDVVGIDAQRLWPAGTVPAPLNNPNDPFNMYLGGTRPYLLWTIGGDDNVFCWNNLFNPLSPNHNFYAIVGNQTQSIAGYTTNIATGRVFTDAMCVVPMSMGDDARLTLDTTNLIPLAGSSVTLSVRGPALSGRRFQLGVAGALSVGTGIPIVPDGLGWVLLDPNDPLLLATLTPPLASLFQTLPSDALGTSMSFNLQIPAGVPPGTHLHLQGYEIVATTPLTTALTLVVN